MNKLFLLILIGGFAITVQQQLQNAMASSFWGDLGDKIDKADANFDAGVDAGRDAGVYDAQDGQGHDSKCPANDSMTWCAGYKIGYTDGYRSANVVQAQEDNDDNDNDN